MSECAAEQVSMARLGWWFITVQRQGMTVKRSSSIVSLPGGNVSNVCGLIVKCASKVLE